MDDYQLEAYDYEVPEAQIAQAPAEPRGSSRLLVLPRIEGACTHTQFATLPSWLQKGDVLVTNQTRVIRARLHARKATGGRVEMLCLAPVAGSLQAARTWRVMARPSASLRAGMLLELVGHEGVATATQIRLQARDDEGRWLVEAASGEAFWQILLKWGALPLPPYIQRPQGPSDADTVAYQSIFAEREGAIAAPTASLHFTEELLLQLESEGIARVPLVLHVGAGTFQPVREECAADVRDHQMHSEWYSIPAATCEAIEACRARGGRVVALGTTVARALESWARSGKQEDHSSLFLYPGETFMCVDGLITNFHQPRSTLLMLVSAFAGRHRVLAAYADAVAAGYRLFSYGDGMLII